MGVPNLVHIRCSGNPSLQVQVISSTIPCADSLLGVRCRRLPFGLSCKACGGLATCIAGGRGGRRQAARFAFGYLRFQFRPEARIHPKVELGRAEAYVLHSELSNPPREQIGAPERDVGCLVRGYGWRVRSVDKNDMEMMKRVADIQAKVFHMRSFLFDDFFFSLFKAQVLSSLLYKIRNALHCRYTCLVADSWQENERKSIVGVVDVTVLAEKDVLKDLLPRAHEYLYVSGMAVDIEHRRQKVATMLLQACDMAAMQWGLEFLILHAYESDIAARRLYSKAGYTVISKDPPWISTWLGRRQRVVLAKRSFTNNVQGQIYQTWPREN